VFQQTAAEALIDHLSIENKKAYDETLDLIQELQDDFVTTQKKYQNDPKMSYHFITRIIFKIKELEAKNNELLASKVLLLFFST
jgi:hypothetical protein